MTDHRIPTTLDNFDGGSGLSRGSSASSSYDQQNLAMTPTAAPPIVGALDPSGPGELGTRTPHPTDILCGRGCSTHHGNAVFRSVVRRHQPQYHSSSKGQKVELARCIVRAVSLLSPPGRFLEKSKSDGLWYEIEPKKALEKTKQALRERYNMKEDDDEYGMEEGDEAVEALERTLAQAEDDAKAGRLPKIENRGGGGGGSSRKRKVSPPQSRLSPPPNADAAAGRPSPAPGDLLDAIGMGGGGVLDAAGIDASDVGMDAPMPPLPGQLLPNSAINPAQRPRSSSPGFRPPASVSHRPSLVNFFFNVPSKLTNLGGSKPDAMSRRVVTDQQQQDGSRPTAGLAAAEHAHVHFAEQQGQHQQGFASQGIQAPPQTAVQPPPPRRRQNKRTSIIDLFRGSLSHFVGVEDQLMERVFCEGKCVPPGGKEALAAARAANKARNLGSSSGSFGASDHGGGQGIGDDEAILADMRSRGAEGGGGDPFDDAFPDAASLGKRRTVERRGAGAGPSPTHGKELTRMAASEIGRQADASEASASRRKPRSGSLFRTFLRFSSPLDEDSHRKLMEDCEKAAAEVEEEADNKMTETAAAAAAAAAVQADPESKKDENENEVDEDAAPSPTKRPRRESSYSLFSLFRPDVNLGGPNSGAGSGPRRKSVFQFMQLLGKADGDDAVGDGIFDDAEEETEENAKSGKDDAAAANPASSVGLEGEGVEVIEETDPTTRMHSLSDPISPAKGLQARADVSEDQQGGGRRRRSSVFNVFRWSQEGWGDFTPV